MDNELAIFLSEYATSQIHWIDIESVSDHILANKGDDKIILEDIKLISNSTNGYLRSSEIIFTLAETYESSNEKISAAIEKLTDDVKRKTERLGELNGAIDEAVGVMTNKGNIFMEEDPESEGTDEDTEDSPEDEQDNVFIEGDPKSEATIDFPLPICDPEEDKEETKEDTNDGSQTAEEKPCEVSIEQVDEPENLKFVDAFYNTVGKFCKNTKGSKVNTKKEDD